MTTGEKYFISHLDGSLLRSQIAGSALRLERGPQLRAIFHTSRVKARSLSQERVARVHIVLNNHHEAVQNSGGCFCCFSLIFWSMRYSKDQFSFSTVCLGFQIFLSTRKSLVDKHQGTWVQAPRFMPSIGPMHSPGCLHSLQLTLVLYSSEEKGIRQHSFSSSQFSPQRVAWNVTMVLPPFKLFVQHLEGNLAQWTQGSDALRFPTQLFYLQCCPGSVNSKFNPKKWT